MPSAERPISAVLQDIVGNIQEIVRSEMRLAKTEVSEEVGKSLAGAALIGAAVLLMVLGISFALLACVYALTLVVPAWMAALIVAVCVGAIAALCFSMGMKKFRKVRAVPKTVANVKENVEWAKQLTR